VKVLLHCKHHRGMLLMFLDSLLLIKNLLLEEDYQVQEVQI
jgi:hypothetical protein